MKKIILAAMLAALATPAVAADSGVYAGLKVGSSNKSVNGISESSTATGVYLGYATSPEFAIELGMSNLGDMASGLVTFSSIEVSAVSSFPVNDTFSIYGKLGFASTTEEAALFGVTGKRSALTYGLGGQFNVSPTLAVRAGWEKHSFGDGTNFYQGDSSWISAGALVKF